MWRAKQHACCASEMPVAWRTVAPMVAHVTRLSDASAGLLGLSLQRHFRVLTKFAHVESRLSGRKRQREGVFYAPVNLCDRRACSASVAVGLYGRRQKGPLDS